MVISIRDVRRAFIADQHGAIAIIFGFTLLLLVVSAGMAIDFGYAHMKKSKLQSASDAAAMAAASVMDATLTQRTTIGQNAFNANYDDHADATFALELTNNNSRIKVTVQHAVKTFLMQVVGKTDVMIHAEAHVPIRKGGFSEVVLVMDYSDSMIDGSKYIRMYEAAAKMIDTLSESGKNKNVKFALVPFSAVVRADIPAAFLRTDIAFDGCTMDRQHPHNTTDGGTTVDNSAKWGDHSVGGHDCSVVAAANLKVLPLTNELDLVKSTLSSFKPHLWTHIAAGAEFGWQVISPDGIFGGARSYDEDQNVKAVILLTDGMQTAPGWGPGESRTVADAEANLRAICSGMKARNIEVFTIGYDLTDSQTLSLLSDCAGEGKHYASSDVDTGLTMIMNSITVEIQEKMMRLVK